MSVPSKLTSRDRWVLFKGKVPKQVEKPTWNASCKDPETWTSYSKAVEARDKMRELEPDASWEIAYALGDGVMGFDLDKAFEVPFQIDSLTKEAAPILSEALTIGGYVEWSTSGTGVHCYWSGEKPASATSKRKIEGVAAAELYDKGRFFIVTEKPYEDDFGIDSFFVDEEVKAEFCTRWFCKGPARENAKVTKVPLTPSSTAGPYVDRLLQELRITEGERNNRAFSVSGNVAKKCGYDFETTLGHMQVINARCITPPLDDKELERVVFNSINKGELRVDADYVPPVSYEGFINHQSIEVVEHRESKSVDRNLSDMINTLKPSKEEEKATKVLPIGKIEGLGGFIGEYMKHVKSTQDKYCPNLAFSGALSAFSAIVGGRVSCQGTVPNLIIAGLAGTGVGKNYARTVNKDLFEKAGIEDRMGPEHISSGEGMVTCLMEGPKVFQLDEATEIFSEMGGRKDPVAVRTGKFIKQAYSEGGRKWKPNARADAKHNYEVPYCYPTIYFTATPTAWWSAFPRSSVQDGLLGRFLCFEQERVRSNGRCYRGPYASEALVNIAKAWKPENNSSGLGTVMNEQLGVFKEVEWKLSDNAQQAALEFSEACEEKAFQSIGSETVADSLWLRSSDKVIKVALLLACSEKGPDSDHVIERGHVDLAIEIVKRSTYTTVYRIENYVGNSTPEQQAQVDIHRYVSSIKPFELIIKSDLYRCVRADLRVTEAAIKKLVKDESISISERGVVTVLDSYSRKCARDFVYEREIKEMKLMDAGLSEGDPEFDAAMSVFE
jgi:hypothetical protein